MENLKIIHYLRIAENVMGIYRNYFLYGRSSKKYILVYVIFKILLCFVLFINNLYFALVLLTLTINMEWFYLFIYLNILIGDIVCIAYGILKSREYEIAISNLMAVHIIYSEEVHYKENLKQIVTNFLISCIVILVVELCFSTWTYYLLTFVLRDRAMIIIVCFTFFCNKINNILDVFALYNYLEILSNLLKCLMATLDETEKKICTDNNQLDLEIKRQNLLEKILCWAELYEHLVYSSQRLTACFKYQVIITLWSKNKTY